MARWTALGALLLPLGCSIMDDGPPQRRLVRVNSVVDSVIQGDNPAARSISYVLFPGLSGTTPDDPQFVEFASYAHCALADRGFVLSDYAHADLAVSLSYGIGAPTPVTEVYSTNARVIESGTTTVIIPPQTYSNTYNQYARYISLQGIDLTRWRASNQLSTLWRTTITSVGYSGDLRLVFPAMLLAGASLIAKDTGGQKNDWFMIDDKPERDLRERAKALRAVLATRPASQPISLPASRN